MQFWAVKFCVAVLTLVLIAAPCLPLIGMHQAGTATAHTASLTHDSFYEAGVDHDHKAQIADHSDRSVHANMDPAGQQMLCPHKEMSSCSGDCVSWLSASRTDDWHVINRVSSSDDPDAGNTIMAELGLAPVFHPPNLIRISPESIQRSASYAIPVYALSQRFRI